MAIKVSFVIPAYNEEHYIGKCLESILREMKGRSDFEVIVADNNSTDQTVAVAKKFPGVIVVHELQKGANAARKRGFMESRGELVAFPDSDTIMTPGWVAYAEARFDHDKKLACISGPFIYYDLPLHIRVLVKVFYGLGRFVASLGDLFFHRSIMIQGGNYMVRRTALQAIGGQDANISFYGDDTDLAMRLSKVGSVKFSFKMPILTSGRRLAKEGPWMMGFRYALNNFWMVFFGRPWTMSSKEVRFSGGETVYKPENTEREILIASIFVFIVLVFLAIVALIIYWIARLTLSR